MKTCTFSIALLVSAFFLSCSENKKTARTDHIITEKDLVPEGVAFDPATQTIFISSTYKKKIVAIDKEGKVSDFIKEGQDDIKSVIGMEVDSKRNCLWAISSEANEVLLLKDPGDLQWRSSVYQYSLKDGKLIKKFELNEDSVFLNDLTVSDDGIVYITESPGRIVYRITPGKDSLEYFVGPLPSQFINGICFADKPGTLFVCSEKGIFSIDVNTKEYFLLPSGIIDAGDIDGLAFHKNYFIAHQGSKVTRLYLSDDRDSIIRSDTLDSGKEFDSSTTGEVSEDHYYYIVNSQLQSGADYTMMKLKPADSLENIIIRKIKL